MKFLPVLFCLATSALAAEPVPPAAPAAPAKPAEAVELPLEVGTLTMTDGRVYEGVKVVGQDAVGLKITHAGGTARLPFEKLPKALAARFPRDPEAAKKQKEAEAKAEAAHDRAVDKALADEGDEKASPLEKAPEMTGDNKAKIASLEGYIERLQRGIDEAQLEVEKSRQRAADLRADAYYTVTTRDSQGVVQVHNRTNGSKLNKARYHDNRAKNYESKINEAQRLIQSTRSSIERLQNL
jgi:hypothetical protein